MKIVLTGTRSGIGAWLANHLCSAGHEVWGLSRGDQSIKNTIALQNGWHFKSSQCDVANWEQVENLANNIRCEWGEVNAIICCAGSQMPIGPSMSVNPDHWSKNIAQNLNGTFFPVRSLYKLINGGSKNAKIICFSGGGATSPRENFSAYACAKTAIVRLVENLSAEWTGKKIDINAIAPGAINTAMTEEVIRLGAEIVGQKEYEQALKQKHSGGASLEKVGFMVDFLLSKETDGISGKLLSAQWDSIENLLDVPELLSNKDIFTLRRIVPPTANL